MTSLLFQDAFHASVGHAFDEMLLLEQMSRLPPDAILRILQSIPEPLLRHALETRAEQARAPEHPGAVPRPVQRSAPVEKRAFPRRKVLRGGRLMQHRPNGTLDVQVRDISAGGCRIGTHAPSVVADRFLLRIVGFDGERDCEVRWRSEEELGVRFLDF